jgi:hypothetical protein
VEIGPSGMLQAAQSVARFRCDETLRPAKSASATAAQIGKNFVGPCKSYQGMSPKGPAEV